MTQAFKDHFSARATGYAAHRPGYPRALVDFLAAAAPRRDLAWDCGCGSGQLSVLLADAFQSVIATDASASQIAAARSHPRLAYRCAPAEASGLPEGVCDLVVAAQAAHWFDLPAFYREARRVARPGSVIALVTYGIMSLDGERDAAILGFYRGVLAPYWPPERRHVEEGYRSLPFPFEEIAAPPLEMRVEWALADLLGYIDTWSAIQALEKAKGPAPSEAFRAALAQVWGAAETIRPVRWPLSLRVGRV